MKTLKRLFPRLYYLKTVLIIIFLAGVVIIYFTQQYPMQNNDNVSDYNLLFVYKDLFYSLYKITHSVSFINAYGRSRRKPIFITTHYIKVLSQPEFIYAFLKDLPLEDILKKDIPLKFKYKEIDRLFNIYVQNSIKEYELHIKTLLFFFIDIGPFIMAYKSFALYHYYSSDILTPGVLNSYQYQNRHKILFTSLRVMVGFCFVFISLYR